MSVEPGVMDGALLVVNCVPMREQRTAKLILKSVFAIDAAFHSVRSKSRSNSFQCSKL